MTSMTANDVTHPLVTTTTTRCLVCLHNKHVVRQTKMSLKLFRAIKAVVWLHLLALVVRQVIDFCGVQWLMIFVNFISILTTISALFHYFFVYFCFNFLLIFYNFFVIFSYYRLLTSSTPLSSLSFDVNSKSFYYFLVQNYLFVQTERQSEAVVVAIEVLQSCLHLFFSITAILLLSVHYHRRRRRRQRETLKTTPPLPPYTISPLHNAHFLPPPPTSASFFAPPTTTTTTTTLNNRSLRRSKRRLRSSSQRTGRKRLNAKLLSNASYYSDSETDFYGHTGVGYVSRLPHGLTNPLYCRHPLDTHHSETRI